MKLLYAIEPTYNTAEPAGAAAEPSSSVAPAEPAAGGITDADNLDNDNSYGDIFDGVDGLDLDDPPAAASASPPASTQNPPPATPAEPTAEKPPASQAAPAEAKPPAAREPSVQPQQQPASQPPAQPADAKPQGTEPSGPPTLEGAMDILQKPEAIQHFAESMFKLDEATVEELQNDATTALPKLLARTFVLAHASALSAMREFVPSIIDQRTAGMRAATEAQDEFFTAFPALKKSELAQDIMAGIQIIRTRNPEAKRADVIQQVGRMVSAMHGIPLPGAGASPGQPAAVRPPPPYVPHVGGGVVQPPASVEHTGFEGMAMEFDN